MKRMINGAEIEYTCDAKGCESFVDDFCVRGRHWHCQHHKPAWNDNRCGVCLHLEGVTE